MSASAHQTHFSLHLQDVKHDFQVLAFTGTEAISQPFAFELQLVSEDPALDLDSLLNRPSFLQFGPDDIGVHGLIDRIAQGDSRKRLTHYAMTLRPHLAYLGHRINQRIFQQQSVPQIIARILQDHGILADRYHFQLGLPYPKREYCVQYDESDLHFIQRLCEEEGLHYHFQHSRTMHKLVFGDDQTVFPRLTSLSYRQDSGMAPDEPLVNRFNVRLETRSTRTTRRHYDFQKPRVALESTQDQAILPDLEDYDYPGRFSDRERGNLLTRRALERHRHDYRLAEGQSNQPALLSGHFLDLTGHPQTSWNQLWLLTEVRHEGRQPQVLEEAAGHEPQPAWQGYRNTFRGTPWDAFYRPPLRHPKPRIAGSQTAIVTGPQDQDIHCDRHGRIKVQFHWDREGQQDASSSCWLRVSSGWAGNRYGAVALPRVGMEVLVTFLEGDPDQPLVTGCLYHAENVPPYALPEHRTRSVFKTLSSPGGGGSNELRIEDRKDQEQIFIHAQRNWDQSIGHDQKIHVGHERHDRVEANSYSEFRAEEHCTVNADRKVEVRANDHLSIAQVQHIKVGVAQLVEAGEEIHIKSGDRLVIDAGMELTLKVGGSFIKLDHSGVSINGPLVRTNQGGYPGIGSEAPPVLPVVPKTADTSVSGRKPLTVQATPKPETSPSSQKPEALIVDVWGDPDHGSQVILLSPEEQP
ncbi:type VI secretion system Vgr family protein [Pseudomonas capsici]|uniref:type VI secretion system Vgr family protein n=1 Tax=Pseudomonas capsici TaxID=2810614 RepID=UPI0021F1378B|nr:type VI secretion system tip protein VgrG [Pseudomonas capsici]MCV4261057.1 type VI secretion system tip protein VgrG [Pseudomonas capsici]